MKTKVLIGAVLGLFLFGSLVSADQIPCYAPCDTLNGWHCDDMGVLNGCSCDYRIPFVIDGEIMAPATCVEDKFTPTPCDGPCETDIDCPDDPEYTDECVCNLNMPYKYIGYIKAEIPGYPSGGAPGTCVDKTPWEANPCFAPCNSDPDCPRIPGICCECDTSPGMQFDWDSTIHTDGTCVPVPCNGAPEFPIPTIVAAVGAILTAYGVVMVRRNKR